MKIHERSGVGSPNIRNFPPDSGSEAFEMNSNSVHSVGKYAATMPKSLASAQSDPRGGVHDR